MAGKVGTGIASLRAASADDSSVDTLRDLEQGSDGALIEAWQLGDRRAGDVLLRRHVEALRKYLQRGGGPVEDLLQETLLQCMRTITGFRGDARFRTFLLAVAGNVRRNHARRAIRAHVSDGTVAEGLASDDSDPESQLDSERVAAAIHSGIALLPEHARRVIRMQYWEDLTSAQIADLLVVPAGSVRRWQVVARKALARKMSRDTR